MTIGAATFIIITVCIEEPIRYSCNRTVPFVEMVETLQNPKQGEIVFYKISDDGDAIKFMVNLDQPIKPQFINSPEALLHCKKPAYFISKDKDFGNLPKDAVQHVRHLASGKIGRDDCVIFTNIEMFVNSLENSKPLSEDY